MRRRQFITLLGGATAVWPLAARAQQSDQMRHIAVLGDTPSVWNTWTAALAERLRELGWTDGRTVAIEYRWSEGRAERVAEFAARSALMLGDYAPKAFANRNKLLSWSAPPAAIRRVQLRFWPNSSPAK